MADQQTSAINRQQVLESVALLLTDGHPRTAREITLALRERGMAGLDKSLVNSVLAREGKGQFEYDEESYRYRLARMSPAVE